MENAKLDVPTSSRAVLMRFDLILKTLQILNGDFGNVILP